MNFNKVSEKEWRYYQNPFTFFIYEEENCFKIIWHYGCASGEKLVENFVLAKFWCSQFIADKSIDQLKTSAPENGRVKFDEIYGYEFVCDGAVKDMGYYCLLPIGHKGECFCRKGYFKSDE